MPALASSSVCKVKKPHYRLFLPQQHVCKHQNILVWRGGGIGLQAFSLFLFPFGHKNGGERRKVNTKAR